MSTPCKVDNSVCIVENCGQSSIASPLPDTTNAQWAVLIANDRSIRMLSYAGGHMASGVYEVTAEVSADETIGSGNDNVFV